MKYYTAGIWIITGFILGGVYGAGHPVFPLEEKFLPCSLMILIECPVTMKMCPCKEKLKNRATGPT